MEARGGDLHHYFFSRLTLPSSRRDIGFNRCLERWSLVCSRGNASLPVSGELGSLEVL